MAQTGIPTGDGGTINPSDGGDGGSDGGGGSIDAGGFGEELGGDPAGDTGRDTGQDDPDDIDTGGFGEELGGDPAGDAGRDTDGGDGGQEDPADSGTGGFGEELGGDPAGDADRDTGQDDPGGIGAGGFGEELGGDPAGDADRATGRDDSGEIDAGGFGEELGGDPAGRTGVAEATEEAERRAVREAAEERFPGADRIVIEEGGGIGEYRVDPWGVGAGQEVVYSFDRGETLSAVQEQMSRTVTVDLQSLGGDPAGRPTIPDTEPVPTTADKPDSISRRRGRDLLDESLEEEFGTELEPGEDYTAAESVDEEGRTVLRAELTEEGRIKVAGVPETGETFLDEEIINPSIERVESAIGINVPGDGDVVQSIQAYLREQSAIHQADRGWIFGPERAAGGPDDPVVGDDGKIELDIAEAMGRRVGEAADPAGIVLGFGQIIESAGEYAYSGSVEAFARGSEESPDIDLPITDQTLQEAAVTARQNRLRQETAFFESAEQTVSESRELAEDDPSAFAGAALAEGVLLVAELGGSAAAGRAAGRAGRRARGRIRTAGGTEIELRDITQEPVVRNIETGGVEGRRFPAAEDRGLYQGDPARAVEEQARRYTPEELEEYFAGAGFEEGVVLKRAMDVEPEGPGVRGFRTQGGAYESPGAFVAPELSPYFLRSGAEASRTSLRPGLPDLGGRPTGVLPRTDVAPATRSRTLGEFAEELEERAGETTARTKPAGAGTPGEIEAVIPPGAEFERVGTGSRLRDMAARFGIGSEFYTTVGGQRIPLRPVAPVGAEAGEEIAESAFGRLISPRSRAGRLSELSEPYRPPVDRPLPAQTPGIESPVDTDFEPFEIESDRAARRRRRREDRSRVESDISRLGQPPTVDYSISTAREGSRAESPGVAQASEPTPASSGRQSDVGSPISPVEGELTTPTVTSEISVPSVPSLGGPVDYGIFVPPPPPTTTTPPPGTFEGLEDEPSERRREPTFIGDRNPVFTDFLDPLTGEVLETERDDPISLL